MSVVTIAPAQTAVSHGLETAMSQGLETAMSQKAAVRPQTALNVENTANEQTPRQNLPNSILYSADHEWTLRKDRKGVQVFVSKVPDSKFRAVLSVMSVQSTPQSLAALVMDFENCPSWAAMCKKAHVLQRLSANQSYVYSLNDAPFPVRDRDVIAKVTWNYNKISGQISMLSYAVTDLVPSQKGIIRVENAISEWYFTPQRDGTVLVENYAHIDPNGAIPAWLTNIMIIDAPYKTMKKMRRIVESGKYDNVDLSFMQPD